MMTTPSEKINPTEEVPADHKPNEETEQAMRDVDEGENLSHAETMEEFWLAMEIDPNA